MSDVTIESKAEVIDEVLTIKLLLEEYHTKISALPRSVTAARSLGVIIARLDGWYQAFALSQTAKPPAKEEIMREVITILEDYLDKKLN